MTVRIDAVARVSLAEAWPGGKTRLGLGVGLTAESRHRECRSHKDGAVGAAMVVLRWQRHCCLCRDWALVLASPPSRGTESAAPTTGRAAPTTDIHRPFAKPYVMEAINSRRSSAALPIPRSRAL
jgi:hypothetical protein